MHIGSYCNIMCVTGVVIYCRVFRRYDAKTRLLLITANKPNCMCKITCQTHLWTQRDRLSKRLSIRAVTDFHIRVKSSHWTSPVRHVSYPCVLDIHKLFRGTFATVMWRQNRRAVNGWVFMIVNVVNRRVPAHSPALKTSPITTRAHMRLHHHVAYDHTSRHI